jgi:hypothetical protein
MSINMNFVVDNLILFVLLLPIFRHESFSVIFRQNFNATINTSTQTSAVGFVVDSKQMTAALSYRIRIASPRKNDFRLNS